MTKKKLNIVYEDKSILVINKPSGLLTISTNKERDRTLYHEVYDYLHKKNQKVFIVNRLDRDTSGLVMFAKNEQVKDYLQRNWNLVRRKYYAIVQGRVDKEGKIVVYLKEGKDLKTYVVESKVGKSAVTVYKPIDYINKYTLLDIEIKTGRKNQIRASLDYINHPIIGDKKYSSTRNPISRLGLHGYYLEFVHPKSKEKIVLETRLPKEFEKMFEKKISL